MWLCHIGHSLEYRTSHYFSFIFILYFRFLMGSHTFCYPTCPSRDLSFNNFSGDLPNTLGSLSNLSSL